MMDNYLMSSETTLHPSDNVNTGPQKDHESKKKSIKNTNGPTYIKNQKQETSKSYEPHQQATTTEQQVPD